MATSKLTAGGSWFFLFRFVTMVGRRVMHLHCVSLSWFGARKLRDDEVTLARAEGSVDILPSTLKASLPPEKLSLLILRSGAPASNKTKAVESLAQACEGVFMDLG